MIVFRVMLPSPPFCRKFNQFYPFLRFSNLNDEFKENITCSSFFQIMICSALDDECICSIRLRMFLRIRPRYKFVLFTFFWIKKKTTSHFLSNFIRIWSWCTRKWALKRAASVFLISCEVPSRGSYLAIQSCQTAYI